MKLFLRTAIIFVSAFLAMTVAASVAVAQSGYRIAPGDVLSVEVLQDPSLNREVLVLPDGSINFPVAGAIRASGQTPEQLEQSLASGIAPNFAVTPNVFVTVRQLAEDEEDEDDGPIINVYFLGEFNAPGTAELPVGSTLLQALAVGEGFTPFAAQKRIQLRRTNTHTGRTSVVTINYRALADGASLSIDPILHEGDVILAPERRLFE